MPNERFLSVATEYTYGSLPTTGWVRSPVVTSSNIALNKDSVPSNAIVGSRGLTNVRAGNDNITGTTELEIAVSGIEFWLYHALGRAWTNGGNPVDTTGATRTASAASAGDTNILVDATAAAALAPNDWIRIGDAVTAGSENSFVRQVTAVDVTGGTENIDVDHPVPRNIGAGEAIFDVDAPGTTFFTTTFTRSVLPTGFSLQHNWEDIAQFYKYSGLKINSFALTVPRTGLATASLDIRGKTSTRAATATGGVLTSVEQLPYISYEAAVQENAVSFGDMLDFAITINNDLDDTLYALGSKERVELPEQKGSATGNVTIFFRDETIAEKFRNETGTSIDLTWTNGSYSLAFEMPSITYTGSAGDPSFTSGFGPVLLDGLGIQATVDSVEGTDVKATVVSDEHRFN